MTKQRFNNNPMKFEDPFDLNRDGECDGADILLWHFMNGMIQGENEQYTQKSNSRIVGLDD